MISYQDSFRELWNEIMAPRSGLELQCHRFRLRTYQNCLVGSELVDWLLMCEKTSTRFVVRYHFKDIKLLQANLNCQLYSEPPKCILN